MVKKVVQTRQTAISARWNMFLNSNIGLSTFFFLWRPFPCGSYIIFKDTFHKSYKMEWNWGWFPCHFILLFHSWRVFFARVISYEWHIDLFVARRGFLISGLRQMKMLSATFSEVLWKSCAIVHPRPPQCPRNSGHHFPTWSNFGVGIYVEYRIPPFYPFFPGCYHPPSWLVDTVKKCHNQECECWGRRERGCTDTAGTNTLYTVVFKERGVGYSERVSLVGRTRLTGLVGWQPSWQSWPKLLKKFDDCALKEDLLTGTSTAQAYGFKTPIWRNNTQCDGVSSYDH